MDPPTDPRASDVGRTKLLRQKGAKRPRGTCPCRCRHSSRLLSRSQDRRGTRTEWVAPGSLNCILVDGCPDTGSSINAISREFVRQQKWPFQRSTNFTPVNLPGNRSATPLGIIELPWTFDGESTTHNLVFHVLPKCAHPVILGREFLKSSQTLSKKFIHRIKKKVVDGTEWNRLFLLDSPHEKTWGTLNGSSACALADTGSDVMIISLNFAKSLNLDIKRGSAYTEWLQLVDGSTKRSAGMIMSAGNDGGIKYLSDFVVLDGIDCDVILSNDFLLDRQVFSAYDLFQTREGEGPHCSEIVVTHQLNLIKRVNKRLDATGAVPARGLQANAEKAEHIRRGNAEDAIAELPAGAEWDAAWAEERRRRSEWDQIYQSLLMSQQQRLAPGQSQVNAQSCGSLSPSSSSSSSSSSPLTTTGPKQRKFKLQF
ncbi:hypothetical protein AJ80_02335 [Polytolypa hystricis UAMH7299]|uniref:Uncharacterized protein n=1 Tax=Polytolypa hystricis (strain UAMH7299) TaxID=1447883 RepID=A0A2B7YQH0_POLH7|nr:hypothetical protein AJ80_02335 [Polytolypa hystricis UAMH7299]